MACKQNVVRPTLKLLGGSGRWVINQVNCRRTKQFSQASPNHGKDSCKTGELPGKGKATKATYCIGLHLRAWVLRSATTLVRCRDGIGAVAQIVHECAGDEADNAPQKITDVGKRSRAALARQWSVKHDQELVTCNAHLQEVSCVGMRNCKLPLHVGSWLVKGQSTGGKVVALEACRVWCTAAGT